MRYSLLTGRCNGRCNGRSPLTSSVLPGDSQAPVLMVATIGVLSLALPQVLVGVSGSAWAIAQPLLGFVARGPRCQAEASSTWSSTAIRALTSSGGTAGNVAMRTWLRPSFR